MSGTMASEGHCSSNVQQSCIERIYYTSSPRTNGLKHYLQQRMKKYCLEHGLSPPAIPRIRKTIVVKPSNNDVICKISNPSNLNMASGSKRDNTQTKIRSCNPLPPKEVIVSEDLGGKRRTSSLPVKTPRHFNVKARSVGMDRYKSLAPQSSTSRGGPRKRRNRRKNKKATSNPSGANENLISSEKPQQKSECGGNDMQSLLDLPPSSLASITGPVTQAIFNGKAYQQQGSGCKVSSDNHVHKYSSTSGIAAISPLPDITLNMDIGNRKSSTSNENLDHPSDIEKQSKILKMIDPQSKGIKPTFEDKVSDSSKSSSSEVIGICLSEEYRKISSPTSSSEIIDSISVTEVPRQLDKTTEQHPSGPDPTPKDKETNIKKKITKLSLPQKRNFSHIAISSGESEETHGTSGYINKSSASLPQKRNFSHIAISSEESEETHESSGYINESSAKRKKEKEMSQEIRIVSAFPEQSDSEVGWVGKSSADQCSPARDKPAALTTSIEGQCFSLSTDGTTDSLISQAMSDIEKRTSPHFLEPRSQECLKHIVGILIQVYGCSMEECLETMSKNKYNMLTTLQELQTMKPCM